MRMRRRLQSGADLLAEAGGGPGRQPRNHPVLITAYNSACAAVPLRQKIQRDAEDRLRFEHLVDGAVSFSFLDQRICRDLIVLLAKRRPNSFSISSQASPLATNVCRISSSATE